VQMAAVQADWNKQYESRSLEEFVASGGTIRVPTVEEKATFLESRDAMKQWFLDNIDNAEEWLEAWESAIAEAEEQIDADRSRIAGRES